MTQSWQSNRDNQCYVDFDENIILKNGFMSKYTIGSHELFLICKWGMKALVNLLLYNGDAFYISTDTIQDTLRNMFDIKKFISVHSDIVRILLRPLDSLYISGFSSELLMAYRYKKYPILSVFMEYNNLNLDRWCLPGLIHYEKKLDVKLVEILLTNTQILNYLRNVPNDNEYYYLAQEALDTLK